MKKLIFLVVVLLSGCTTPVHYFENTVNLKPEELATVAIRDNEIKILELNDEKYLGEHSNDYSQIYLKPGKYKFTAMLTWIDIIPISGLSISTSTHSQYLRTGCLDLKPGVFYNLFARNPGNAWIFVVSNKRTGSSDYITVPEC